jgi:hypothetical protein
MSVQAVLDFQTLADEQTSRAIAYWFSLSAKPSLQSQPQTIPTSSRQRYNILYIQKCFFMHFTRIIL